MKAPCGLSWWVCRHGHAASPCPLGVLGSWGADWNQTVIFPIQTIKTDTLARFSTRSRSHLLNLRCLLAGSAWTEGLSSDSSDTVLGWDWLQKNKAEKDRRGSILHLDQTKHHHDSVSLEDKINMQIIFLCSLVSSNSYPEHPERTRTSICGVIQGPLMQTLSIAVPQETRNLSDQPKEKETSFFTYSFLPWLSSNLHLLLD